MIRVEIKGDKEFRRYITGLPKELDKQLTKDNYNFMKKVRKSAKLIAPKDTGALANSIKLKRTITKGRTKQWKLVAGGGSGGRSYAAAQEEGFTPHRVFIKGSNKMAPGLYWVKRNKPFIGPAVEKNIGRFMQKLNSSTARAIKKKY